MSRLLANNFSSSIIISGNLIEIFFVDSLRFGKIIFFDLDQSIYSVDSEAAQNALSLSSSPTIRGWLKNICSHSDLLT